MSESGIPNKEELKQRKRRHRNLMIRNWLNGAFMLLALIAIVGVCYYSAGERGLYVSYGIAILAVIIKMVEAIFRLPGVLNKI